MPDVATPFLAHIAGVPVEEVLPGLLAGGAIGIRAILVYIRARAGG